MLGVLFRRVNGLCALFPSLGCLLLFSNALSRLTDSDGRRFLACFLREVSSGNRKSVSRESVRRFSLARQGGCPKRGRGECRQSKFTDDFHLFVLWSKRGLRSQVKRR